MNLTGLKKPETLRLFSSVAGYSLFAVAIVYGVYNAPEEIWKIQIGWILVCVCIVIVMFFLQQWQLNLLLRCHAVKAGWLYPALLNARRGFLNTLLPGRSGSLVLLHNLMHKYDIKWRYYLQYYILSGLISIWVSVIATVGLLISWNYGALMLLSTFVIFYYFTKNKKFKYADRMHYLLFIAVCLFLAAVLLFFCILHGLGYALGLREASYFAVALNAIAQFSITPGNIGVREVVMGLVSPFVTLPMSVGVIAGSLVLVLRLTVYGMSWAILEFIYSSDVRDK